MSLKGYIEKYTQENGLVAKMTERKITSNDIENYIIDCARKELDGQDGAIDDATINNWIVHYVEDAYKEKEAKKEEESKPEVKVVAPEPKKKEEQHFEQLDLFESLNS